jgi:hypothetical protein
MEGNAITVKIGAETDQVEQGLRSIQASLGRLEQSSQQSSGVFDSSFQKIAGAFTVGSIAAEGFQKVVDLAFSAAREVVQGFSDALDLGGRLNELSARTGETAGKLLVLETAFKNSGLEANAVGTAINKLQNFMQDAANGGDRQTAAMDRLGISMADLSGKTPTEQMGVFASKIAAIEDPTARAAAASEIFGDKLGGKLLPVLTNFSGNLEDARAKVGSLEQVMDENAATFDAAGETIDAIKGKFAALAAGILSETIPALKDLGTSMEQVDAAALGSQIGQFLSPALERLAQITVGANASIQELIRLFTTAPSNTTFFGQAINTAAESLNGFNHWMNKAFTYLTPFGAGMEILRQKGEEVAATQNSAASAMGATATQAQAAATATQAAATAAEDLNSSLLTLSGDGSGMLSGVNEGASQLSASFGTVETSIGNANTSLTETNTTLGTQLGTLGELNASYALWSESSERINAAEIRKNEILEKQRANVEASLAAMSATLSMSTDFANNVSFQNISGMAKDSNNAANDMERVKTVGEAMQSMPTPPVAKDLADKSREARELIGKYGDYIEKDLKNKSYPDIIDELNIPGLFTSTEGQIDAIVSYIEKKMAEPVELKIQTNFDPDKFKADLNQPIQLNISGNYDPNQEVRIPLEDKPINMTLNSGDFVSTTQSALGDPIQMSLDASAAIQDIRQELEKNVDVAVNSSSGQQILDSIKSAVDAIRTAVEKIEPKLPTAALA